MDNHWKCVHSPATRYGDQQRLTVLLSTHQRLPWEARQGCLCMVWGYLSFMNFCCSPHVGEAQYFTWCLYSFVKAAKTKYHKPSSLNSRDYFSHSCRGQESEIRVLAGWFLLRGCEKNISSWPLFLAYRWSSLYSNGVLPVCQSVSKCPYFIRTSITLD